MRLLFIHSDFIEFEVKKPALKSPPPLAEEDKKGRAEEALVVFYSVEKPDEAHADAVVEKVVANIRDIMNQVKAPRVMLYPYAHLSNELASPAHATLIGDKLLAATKAAGYETTRAPFGYYKGFTVKAKGHPLAELSRTVRFDASGAPAAPTALVNKGASAAVAAAPSDAVGPAAEAHESEAIKKEKKLVSNWFVLTPENVLTPAKDFDFSPYPELAAFHRHETQGTRAAGEEPPHVKMMREMELVDYEPGSDPGNFRWYPKGSLVKRLLETRVSDIVASAGGMRVETPIMYDYEHPALAKYLNRFPARQYVLKSEDKEYFLRFAACFGQYLIMHDMTISHRDLPVRLYELTHYSFRREQRGELSGLRRLRTFTMPDMHTLVADLEQGKEEFLRQFKLSMQWMEDTGMEYNAGVRFVRSFFEENREFAVGLAKLLGRPILLEIWDERFFYFVMKFEFNVVDTQGKAAALSTVQIDVENAERFDINYTDASGAKRHPYLLHASLSGSIDRNVYALLETEARKIQRGEKAQLPFWLAPTQVRFCPVNDSFAEECMKLAEHLHRETGARVDVDDRTEGVGRKIRDSEKEWVPFTIVYGEKEHGLAELPIRVRGVGDEHHSLDALAEKIRHLQGDRPLAPLAVPMRLKDRPGFSG
ncbi:MAG: threonine--tRNA ligase [Thermoplasmatota archaeon]